MDILQFKDELNFEYNGDQEIIDRFSELYSYQGYKPTITIEGNVIHIHVDSQILNTTQATFDRACELCNKQKFDEAITLFKEVVKICPLHADAFRNMAQAYMMLGDLDKAVDYDIEALKIDAGNLWALVLMGNLMGRKGDLETAMIYYKKVLEYHPDNIVALNNIGGALMEQGNFVEAIEVFSQCLKTDKSYMNAYYGLALAYSNSNDLKRATDVAMEGVLHTIDRKENPQVREELLKLLCSCAKKLVEKTNYMHLVNDVKNRLKGDFNEDIVFEADENLSVTALLKYGRAHHRDCHVVKYKPSKSYVDHLMLHELTHLRMNLAASREGKNKIFSYGEVCKRNFMSRYEKYFHNLSLKLGRDKVEEFAESLLKGISLQMMNCPLDLLVEDEIYNKYPDARPLQLLSLLEQEQENIKSISKGLKNPGMFPNQIVRTSKIMNLVSSLHLKELYGFNFLHYYKPSQVEIREAEDLYEEYKAYRDNYKPGEEYDLVMYFIEQFDSESFFEIHNEQELAKSRDFDRNPVDESGSEEIAQRFGKGNEGDENEVVTFMMAMYMMGAMEYFEKKPITEIKQIAFEIAMLGCGGITPEQKSGYKVNSIPEKDFGGYELLAYYYVSWAIAIPEKLDDLQLPFKTAYATAKQMYDAKKNGK